MHHKAFIVRPSKVMLLRIDFSSFTYNPHCITVSSHRSFSKYDKMCYKHTSARSNVSTDTMTFCSESLNFYDIAFPDWIKYTHAQSYRKQNKFCTPRASRQNKFCTPFAPTHALQSLRKIKFVTKTLLYFIQSGNAI